MSEPLRASFGAAKPSLCFGEGGKLAVSSKTVYFKEKNRCRQLKHVYNLTLGLFYAKI